MRVELRVIRGWCYFVQAPSPRAPHATPGVRALARPIRFTPEAAPAAVQPTRPLSSRNEGTTIDGFFKGVGALGWDSFHAAYFDAKGFLRVSAVGFDEGHAAPDCLCRPFVRRGVRRGRPPSPSTNGRRLQGGPSERERLRWGLALVVKARIMTKCRCSSPARSAVARSHLNEAASATNADGSSVADTSAS